MSRTLIHKLEAKFKNKILPFGKYPVKIEYKQLAKLYPRFARKKWARANFDKGYYFNLRNKKRHKLLKHQILNEINQ